MSNSEVRLKVMDPKVQSLGQAPNKDRLKWLGHILRMPTERLSPCTLFSEAVIGRRIGRGGQLAIWEKGMKTSTSGLAHVRSDYRVEDPRDPLMRWLAITSGIN